MEGASLPLITRWNSELVTNGHFKGARFSLGDVRAGIINTGPVVFDDYQAFVRLRVALPYAKVDEFSAKLADFSRGSLQLLAIEE